jgi:hypothetical protein
VPAVGNSQLNNGERQFEQKWLAPRHEFELQFTAQQRVPAGKLTYIPKPSILGPADITATRRFRGHSL